MALLTYSQVLAACGSATKHLLLGNGFSIACDRKFNYPDLFAYAKNNGLSPTALAVFSHLGENNFEAVLRLLEDVDWACGAYGVDASVQDVIRRDITIIRDTLVSAVAHNHLARPNEVDPARVARCALFLRGYKNIFTTNYDLLLYWVVLSDLKSNALEDTFRAPMEEPEAEFLVFAEPLAQKSGILYLHGALHLYTKSGETRKHSWEREGRALMDLVRDGLDVGKLPLFVAEGDHKKKLEQINGNGYLSYCLRKLEKINKAPLVVYGSSLGPSDKHIVDALVRNINLEKVYIGLYENLDSPRGTEMVGRVKDMMARRERIRMKYKKGLPLIVQIFEAKSVPVWDEVISSGAIIPI